MNVGEKSGPSGTEYHTWSSNFATWLSDIADYATTNANRYGYYMDDNKAWRRIGTYQQKLANHSIVEGFGSSWSSSNTSSSTYFGYFLVSDGGTTLSSIQDPSLNSNNPNAPGVADVSAPVGMAGATLALFLMGARRNKRV